MNSTFECRLELTLSVFPPEDPQYEVRHFDVATFNFNPNLDLGDIVYVQRIYGEKFYEIEAKVVQFKTEIISGKSLLEERYPDIKYLYRLRVILEIIDREMMVEISETVRRENNIPS